MPPKFADPVEFKAENHSYWRGQKRIPAVGDILKKVGLSKDFTGISPFYANRGIATHLAIKYWLEGRLNEETIDEVVKPHFEAFKAYWRSRSDVLKAIETPMGSLDGSFAGTPDLVTDKAIFDWKCSKQHDPVAELQGQAYKILAFMNGFHANGKPLPFIAVELHDDGTWKEFQYGMGIEEWSSVLSLYSWKIK